LPAGAVLQLVDNYMTLDPSGEIGGYASPNFRRGKEVWTSHFEAWVALPNQKQIVRPADKKSYPLVPAVGPYDPLAAAKVQWVVFVSKCDETKSPCVYFGAPVLACGRAGKANEYEGLGVVPAKCPLPPDP
jgi:hypothetical protein